MSDLLLAIDVGTTSCKAGAFDARGNRIAQADQPYPTYYPRPGWAEQKAEEWVEALQGALSSLSQKLGRRGKDLVAGALSAHGPTLVLVGHDGRALSLSPTWQDQRSLPQGKQLLDRELGPRWLGLGPPRTGFVAKLLWAKIHWPEAFKGCTWAGGVKAYTGYWLTGQVATEPSSGPGGDEWPKEVFDHIGFPIEKLPPVLPSTARLGTLRMEVAEKCGLPAGLPIFLGLNDGASATLGSGAIEPGDACISIGTNGVGRLILDKPFDPEAGLSLEAFFWPFVPGRWVVGGMTLTGGNCLSWLHGLVAEEMGYDQLLREAAESPPGSKDVIFLPYLMGRGSPFPTESARGGFFGLSLVHSRRDLVRAVVEGIAFAIKDIFSAFAALGYPFRQGYVTGGGAQNALVRQIVADVLNRKLTLAGSDATLGAAIMAAVASGIYADIPSAVAAMVSPVLEVMPDPLVHALYKERYTEYRRLARLLGYEPNRVGGQPPKGSKA